jgi:protoheme IX farnesyltransferase
MSSLTSTAPDLVGHSTIAPRAAARGGLLSQYLALTKARLSALVLVTTAVGFVLATPESASINWSRLLWTMLGTALCAGCASALNQLWEISRDARMLRTRSRPLPSGAMSPMHAFIAAMVMGYLGVAMLGLGANLFAAGLALLTIVLYALVYTPLKARSTTNTIVGAVCGAIPPMIGWVAAAGRLDIGAWIMAAILFVWQIPHFFALAWLYRADYQRGGFVMLPVLDRDGRITTRVVILTSLMLVPLGMLATLLDLAGLFSAAASLLLGLAMLILAMRLHLTRSNADARLLFLASIAYLPLLLAMMVVDRGPLGH